MAQEQQPQQQPPQQKPIPYIPAKKPKTDYPLIDNDPHFRRVLRYARTEDYAYGAALAAVPPGLMYYWEAVSPSHVGKGGFAPAMRLAGIVGLTGGFLLYYQRSLERFYGVTENQREIDMDMREMVDKVKKGEPLYGRSDLTEHHQGVAARNSRYSGAFFHLLPMFNFVNHNHHGIDTAKYYQQAERELEAERAGAGADSMAGKLAKSVGWKDG